MAINRKTNSLSALPHGSNEDAQEKSEKAVHIQYTQTHPNQKCGTMKVWQCWTSTLIQNMHMNFGRNNLSIIELNTNQRSNCFV